MVVQRHPLAILLFEMAVLAQVAEAVQMAVLARMAEGAQVKALSL